MKCIKILQADRGRLEKLNLHLYAINLPDLAMLNLIVSVSDPRWNGSGRIIMEKQNKIQFNRQMVNI